MKYIYIYIYIYIYVNTVLALISTDHPKYEKSSPVTPISCIKITKMPTKLRNHHYQMQAAKSKWYTIQHRDLLHSIIYYLFDKLIYWLY